MLCATGGSVLLRDTNTRRQSLDPVVTAALALALAAGADEGMWLFNDPPLKMLRDKYGILVKRVETRFFNGIRISPHVFNTETEIDFALRTIRAELG